MSKSAIKRLSIILKVLVERNEKFNLIKNLHRVILLQHIHSRDYYCPMRKASDGGDENESSRANLEETRRFCSFKSETGNLISRMCLIRIKGGSILLFFVPFDNKNLCDKFMMKVNETLTGTDQFSTRKKSIYFSQISLKTCASEG